ncbi:prolipoprotein diacylglyceryl transferase [Paenibacillaceae bacterium]|nr:prolipoprotein diacylglyceryl transferase [Paenibacillaceae bacterium]
MTLLKINPIAFQLGPIPVHWYGVILGSAALIGLLLAVQEGKRFGLSPDFFMDLLLLGVPSAIIGARIYYVAFKWDEYRDNWVDIFKIWNGGIAIYGALIGAILCGIIYFKRKGYNFWRIADICAPGLIVGQMIGRWGNFINQEAYGGETSESFLRESLHLPGWIVDQMWVVNQAGEGAYHHPAFLYESLWSFVGLILLFILRRQSFLRAGELLMSYFIWYSIGRFFIEGVRTDSLAFQGPDWLASIISALWAPMTVTFDSGYLDPNYGNVRISQVVALLLILAGILIIVIRRVTGAASERYSDPIVNSRVDKTAEAVLSEDSAAKPAASKHREKPIVTVEKSETVAAIEAVADSDKAGQVKKEKKDDE